MRAEFEGIKSLHLRVDIYDETIYKKEAMKKSKRFISESVMNNFERSILVRIYRIRVIVTKNRKMTFNFFFNLPDLKSFSEYK